MIVNFSQFFRLPVDIYQTARVVKILLMMERGVPIEFKGKSLAEIEMTPNEQVEIIEENPGG